MFSIIPDFRKNRAVIFLNNLAPNRKDKILDLGGGDGSYFSNITDLAPHLFSKKNIFVADLNNVHLKDGKELYGFNFLKIDVSKRLPFSGKYFDIIFCNSLIEHATGIKEEVIANIDSVSFSNNVFKYQKMLADEIRRVGKRYFVQTPNKYFPIESHTLMPFLIIYISRFLQLKLAEIINRLGISNALADWSLLTKSQMQQLFPEAEIIEEKFMGFTKSLIAIKK